MRKGRTYEVGGRKYEAGAWVEGFMLGASVAVMGRKVEAKSELGKELFIFTIFFIF